MWEVRPGAADSSFRIPRGAWRSLHPGKAGPRGVGVPQGRALRSLGRGYRSGRTAARAERSGAASRQPGRLWGPDRRAATRRADGNGASVPRRGRGGAGGRERRRSPGPARRGPQPRPLPAARGRGPGQQPVSRGEVGVCGESGEPPAGRRERGSVGRLRAAGSFPRPRRGDAAAALSAPAWARRRGLGRPGRGSSPRGRAEEVHLFGRQESFVSLFKPCGWSCTLERPHPRRVPAGVPRVPWPVHAEAELRGSSSFAPASRWGLTPSWQRSSPGLRPCFQPGLSRCSPCPNPACLSVPRLLCYRSPALSSFSGCWIPRSLASALACAAVTPRG